MSDEFVFIAGESELQNAIGADLQKRIERYSKAIHTAGLVCQGIAKKNCPVGTPESTHIKGYHGGRLRQSIQVDNSKQLESTVGTNVSYAVYVHEGTYKMKGRPFLRQGFDAGAKQLEADGYGGAE